MTRTVLNTDIPEQNLASVLPFQNCVNSVSGFASSVFYRFRIEKFRFLQIQIFKIQFHVFHAIFLV